MFYTARRAHITKEESRVEWQLICICAISILEDACTKICNGDICMQDLSLLNRKKAQMSKLCSAATVDVQDQSGMPSADTVIANLELRLKEYEQFEEYRNQLNNLLSYLTSVRIQGNIL